ncbi:Hsp70 family protein [Pedobacter sp. NJ-S-72]
MSLFANICTWDKMNFFNGLRIQKDLQDYYHYSKKDRKFKNLITLIENNLGYSVFRSIEKTKITLSDEQVSQFNYSNMEIEIDEEVSKEQYAVVIEKDIKKISVYLDEFMLKNNIKAEEIDSLFLTGGSSLVGGVQNLFRNKFPHIPVNSGEITSPVLLKVLPIVVICLTLIKSSPVI